MKKLFLSCLCIALAVALFGCGGNGGEDASGEPSVEGGESSQPNDNSTPVTDNSSDASADMSDVSSDISADTSSDNSNNTSEDYIPPEIFLPDSTSDEAPYFDIDSAIEATVNAIAKNGVSYRIAYTKENPTPAKKCITNPEIAITAIFDGSTTRFFDAVTGEYYTILVGEYCSFGVGGCFLSDDGSKGISFNRSSGTVAWENVGKTDIIAKNYVYWSESNKLAYTYKVSTDGSVSLYAYSNTSYVPCISNGKYGIVNNGKVLVDFEYDYIESYQGCAEYASNGSVGVFRAVKGGKTYYISSNGSVLTPEGYSCGSAPYGNRAWVFDGDHGFVLEFN